MIILLCGNYLYICNQNTVDGTVVVQGYWIVINYKNQPVIGRNINSPLAIAVT
ncbi:hypothetical protein SAMN05444008_101100 [Cnuella takakiae]|uniref:Uncharacterized protein n=1 Tax=Cnuella takakiae TaxID=1302690 RepID=A0A1M4SEP2_9BACT|nr:hypothetical protein SAMN05444008_101100 [Cnuella takakiae]